jgi:hypothetical protein
MERDHVMALDFDPTVVGIASQPFWLSWRDEAGKLISHAPDFFARRADGTSVVVLPPGGAAQAAGRGPWGRVGCATIRFDQPSLGKTGLRPAFRSSRVGCISGGRTLITPVERLNRSCARRCGATRSPFGRPQPGE